MVYIEGRNPKRGYHYKVLYPIGKMYTKASYYNMKYRRMVLSDKEKPLEEVESNNESNEVNIKGHCNQV